MDLMKKINKFSFYEYYLILLKLKSHQGQLSTFSIRLLRINHSNGGHVDDFTD